jgi:hypothetical protein
MVRYVLHSPQLDGITPRRKTFITWKRRQELDFDKEDLVKPTYP